MRRRTNRRNRRADVRSKLIIVLVIATFGLGWALSAVAGQNQGAAPPQQGQRAARGARPRGPAGPLPRLSDGHPDLTGIWNGFGGSGNDAPDMHPWAEKLVADLRANNGAEDFEARCLPGGPPRAAPYHTALFATPKLVLML